MNRQDVEKIITEYREPIFGFALKRCKNIHDAEDFSKEIVLKAFRALLVKDDVADMGKYIWTVAHNAHLPASLAATTLQPHCIYVCNHAVLPCSNLAQTLS